MSPERPESTKFTCPFQELEGVPRRKESFARLYDSTKHSGALVVGLPFDYPTVKVPGSRQDYKGPRKAQQGQRAAQVSRLGHAAHTYLVSAISTVHPRPSLSYKG